MCARYIRFCIIAIVGFTSAAPRTSADEGFWLFNDPPKQLLKERYNYTLTDAWMEHLRLSTVRFRDGGTGSFVSSDGLILTNYHVIRHYLHEAGLEDSEEVKNGFLARTREDEFRSYRLRVELLDSIEDVTAQVRKAVGDTLPVAEARKKRHELIRAIEEESEKKTGLKSSVLSLRELHQHHLYRYKVYPDVRVVFLPPKDAGRWFDVCFLRAYEKEKPAKTGNFHRCVPRAPGGGELVMSAGHPVETYRGLGALDIAYYREWLRMQALGYKWELLGYELCARKPGNDPDALRSEYWEVMDKLSRAEHEISILDPNSSCFQRRKERQAEVLRAIRDDPQLSARFEPFWNQYCLLAKRRNELVPEYMLIESGMGFGGHYFRFARSLVRISETSKNREEYEAAGVDESDLEEYRRLIGSRTIPRQDLEEAWLACSLTGMAAELGRDHELVKIALAGKHPMDRAQELSRNTRLGDRSFRINLMRRGAVAIATSDDPLIVLARSLEPAARRLRKLSLIESIESSASCFREIPATIEAAVGRSSYPDGSGSLRFSFGSVITRKEPRGSDCLAWTLGDACLEADNADSVPEARAHWVAPTKWKEWLQRTDQKAPVFLWSNSDGYYGNSGSPVLNGQGELIAVWARLTPDSSSRTFEYVDSEDTAIVGIAYSGIREILEHIFDARELLDELDRK
jgi:hypothetical protein